MIPTTQILSTEVINPKFVYLRIFHVSVFTTVYIYNIMKFK